jgi:hypothetical protein
MTRAYSVLPARIRRVEVSVVMSVSCCAGGVSTWDIYGEHLENSCYKADKWIECLSHFRIFFHLYTFCVVNEGIIYVWGFWNRTLHSYIQQQTMKFNLYGGLKSYINIKQGVSTAYLS